MLSIKGRRGLTHALSSAVDDRIKQLLRLRCAQLMEDQPDEDIGDLAHFAIVERGNSAADLERTIGFSILRNPADGSRAGEPDFSPGWEWVQDHGWGWEMVWVMSDCGFGHVIIIPKEQGVDPELLNFCKEYASKHA